MKSYSKAFWYTVVYTMSNVEKFIESEDKVVLEVKEVKLPQRESVESSFNKKIRQAGNGLDLSGKGKIEVEFVGGVKKDIVHDHMYAPPIQSDEQYKKIRQDRIARKQQRERELYGYSISEDRFNAFENKFFKGDLAEKARVYKKLGVSYRGSDGVGHAFSQYDKSVRQDCDTFDRGQDKLKSIYRISTIDGRHNYTKDYAEEKHEEVLQQFSRRSNKPMSKTRRSVNFHKVLEQDIRNRKDLLHANQRESVNSSVTTAMKNYNKKVATGGIKEARGRFQAGHMRRRFLDMAQRAQKKGGDYEFTLDVKESVNPEANHFNNGTDGGAEQLDKLVKHEKVGDHKPHAASVNIESVPTQI